MATGFYLTKICFRGDNRQDALVLFGPGLSVVSGPSDTGKTIIGDAINYVFGGGDPPERANESQGYSVILVECRCYSDERVFTLQRSWNGGIIHLHESTIDDVDVLSKPKRLAQRHGSKSGNDVSKYLLGLSGLTNLRVRINARGETTDLSFRDLVEYVLIDEGRIIGRESPIHSSNVIESTRETSVFKVLITGSDDKNIQPSIKPDIAKAQSSARNDVYDALIRSVRDLITEINLSPNELQDRMSRLALDTRRQSEWLARLTSDISAMEERRSNVWSSALGTQAALENKSQLIERFRLLQRQYSSDLDRLRSTYEAAALFSQVEPGPCPLCGADHTDQKHPGDLSNVEIEGLLSGCEAESRKIALLDLELTRTIAMLVTEKEALEIDVGRLKLETDALSRSIDEELRPQVTRAETDLLALLSDQARIDRALYLRDEHDRLIIAKESAPVGLETEEPLNFAPVSTQATDKLCEIVRNLLLGWSYPDLSTVSFDERNEDIIVSGKSRSSHGKGYRAVLYAAFAIGVLKLCRSSELPHPGFIVMDSPLVTYRGPDDSEDEVISEGLAETFYRGLAQNHATLQIIVFENDDPPVDVQDSLGIAYTRFTKIRNEGRYGLFPVG